MTKTEMFETLKAMVATSDLENANEITEMIDTQLAQLATRAVKSKERAAAKRDASDMMRKAILEALTNDYVSVDVVLEKVADYPEISRSKVISRLTTLCSDGHAVKQVVKGEDGKKTTVYALA